MSRRILLIDADPAFQTLLSQALGRYRLAIDAESDPDEAIAHGATNAPAAIVVAVEEPEKGGFKVFQRLKKGPLAKIPTVLVTASVSPDSFAKHRGLKVHADEYVDKREVSREELIDKFDKLIGLGTPADEDLDIPVEVDDIALTDGDLVLDETIGEDEAPPARGSAGPADRRLHSAVEAETDAAFEALMGGGTEAIPFTGDGPAAFADEAAPFPGDDAAAFAGREEPTSLGNLEPAEPRAAAPAPASVHDAGRDDGRDDGDAFDTFSRESMRPPMGYPPASRLESAEISLRSADMIPLDRIMMSPDLQQAGAAAAPAPEPAPPPMSIDDLDVAEPEPEPAPEPAPAPAPSAPSRPAKGPGKKFLDAPTVIEPRLAPVDLGLDEVAQEAESDQSGVFDRRALRKIGELERQNAQLKSELERARAAASEGRGPGREREFRHLREQLIQRESELGRAKQDLAARERELDEAQERVRAIADLRQALEARAAELEQRLDRDGSKVTTLESKERTLSGHLVTLQHEIEVRAQALATAEAARAQLERDLANERALRAAGASDAERALRVEREQMIARHHHELAALRGDLGLQHAAALEALRAELEARHAGAVAAAIDAARNDIGGEAEQTVSQLEARHAAELAGLREELARTARDHEAALAAARAEREAAVQTALENLERIHDGAMGAARAEHEAAIADVERVQAALVESTRSEHEAQLAALGRTHEQALARVESERAAYISRLEAAHAAQLEAAHAAQLEAVTAAGEQALAEAAGRHAAELTSQANQHAAELAAREQELLAARREEALAYTTALDEFKAELDRVVASSGSELAGVRRELEEAMALHEATRAHATAEHEAQAARLAAAHAEELSRLAEDKQRAIDDIQRASAEYRNAAERTAAQHRDELAHARQAAEREAAEYRTALLAAKRALDEAHASHQAEREAAEQAHAQAQAELRATHERAMAVANGEIVKVKAIADAEHNRAVKELAAERDEVTRGLSSARDTIRRHEGELAAAVQTIADRNAELRAHAAAIAERDQRIAELRQEIETLEHENASYQEQVLRAYQKIKADEVMVARAKKAMAIALTVLDDEKPEAEPT
jgi:CheY-like chemotaxis protein